MEFLGATAAADQLLKEAFKLVQLIRNIHDKYKGAPKEIEAWRQEIEDFSELIKHIETLPDLEGYNIHGTIESCRTTCCELIGIFSGLDFADGDKRLHKTWMAIKGIDQEPVVKKHFEKLQSLKVTLLTGINVAQSEQGYRTAQDVQFIKTAIQPGTEEDRCLKSLYLTNPIDDRDAIVTAKGAKVAGTCEWIASTIEYKAWIASPPSLLWVSGGPGKGKTFISIFLTERLSSSADVIYFFCDNKISSRNTAIAIIRGLLYQLVSRFPGLLHHVLTPWKVQQNDLFNSNSFESLWRIFQKMLEDLGPDLICVIDGLDECTEDSLKSLLQKIKMLFTEHAEEHKLRLVILSRRRPECLQGTLGSFPQIDLDSDQISNQADVNTYITSRVAQLAQQKGISMNLVKHIEEIFRKKSENTFLWVSFMADDLETKTVPNIERGLETLPTGLDEVYGRILHHIKPENTAIIALMLQWISLALRPLTVPELAEAMKIRETNFLSKEDICLSYIKSCGHLLQISASTNGVVTFVHQSVKDYLFGSAKHHKISAFQINKEQGDLEVACQLLSFIQNEWLHCYKEYSHQLLGLPRSDAYPFVEYARWNWGTHLQQLQDTSLWLLIDRNPSFFSDFSAVRGKWCDAISPPGHIAGAVSLLQFACRFELLALVKKLLKHKRRYSPFTYQRYINSQGPKSSNSGPALVHAFYQRYINSLGLKGSNSGPALVHAIYRGNIELTQLLLSYKANIEIPCPRWDNKSALYYVAKSGTFEMFQLLAETKRGRRIIDADIKACQNSAKHDSLLHRAAASYGRSQLCSVLIKRYHYNVEYIGDWGQTPICNAIESGSIDLARMFVKNWGASIAAADKMLQAAARSFSKREILDLVISEFKIDINARDESGQTVLHYILEKTMNVWDISGTYDFLVRCLGLGADPSLHSTNGDSPLHVYKWFAHHMAVSLRPLILLLRDGRLGVNDKGSGGNMLLHKLMHSAFDDPKFQNAKFNIRPRLASLLDVGADRALVNSDGLTTLQLAKVLFDESEHSQGILAGIVDILENYATVSNHPQRLDPLGWNIFE